MQENHNEPNSRMLETLLKEKFGELYYWTMPIICKTVGPYTPEVFTRFEARRTDLIERCMQELDFDSVSQLVEPAQVEDEALEQQTLEWGNFLRPEIYALKNQMPNWMSGGFGHPEYAADFEYWGQMAKFQLHEALLLSVGIEPRHVEERDIDFATKNIGQNRLAPAMEYLAKRREQFRRYFPAGYNGWHSIRPKELKAWVDGISLDVHSDFYAQLEQRTASPKAIVKKESEKNISLQERETLLKLIAAMSCEQYGFDPEKSRNPATSSILHDIETVGLTMDSNTIRKWLKEAVALVPNEYWGK